jgi:hypothetical protein
MAFKSGLDFGAPTRARTMQPNRFVAEAGSPDSMRNLGRKVPLQRIVPRNPAGTHPEKVPGRPPPINAMRGRPLRKGGPTGGTTFSVNGAGRSKEPSRPAEHYRDHYVKHDVEGERPVTHTQEIRATRVSIRQYGEDHRDIRLRHVADLSEHHLDCLTTNRNGPKLPISEVRRPIESSLHLTSRRNRLARNECSRRGNRDAASDMTTLVRIRPLVPSLRHVHAKDLAPTNIHHPAAEAGDPVVLHRV